MLKSMLVEFNNVMKNVFNQIFDKMFEGVKKQEEKLIDEERDLFILDMSLPSTAFNFFSKYLYRPG